MSIITRQDVFAYLGKPTAEKGFTLVELLVVLAIFSLLLSFLYQGGLTAVLIQQNSLEKQQVLYLAQQIYAKQNIEDTGDLSYSISEREYSKTLTEKIVRIENTKGKYWTFYYLQEKNV